MHEINTVLLDHFDKILVLTVSRFTQRHQTVKQKLQGISFDFFYGIDKYHLTEEYIKHHYTYDKNKSLSVTRYFPPLNTGEIACALSHRMIYNTIINNNWKNVLILEDDVVLNHNAITKLADCLSELPENWDLFYLGYHKNEKPTIKKKIKQYWYCIMSLLGMSLLPEKMILRFLPKKFSDSLLIAGFHDCTHAYAISLEGAKKLLALQTPVQYRSDNALSTLVMDGSLNAFICRDQIFSQEMFVNGCKLSYVRETPAIKTA